MSYCSVALPHDAVGWSALCECGITCFSVTVKCILYGLAFGFSNILK